MKETSKKIGVSQDWLHKTYPYNPAIKNMTHMIVCAFKKVKIVTSEIYVSEYPKLFIFHFTIVGKINVKLLKHITNYLSSIIVLKYNKNAIFDYKWSPSLYHDDLILSSWLKSKIEKNPRRLRFLMKKVFNKKKLPKRVLNKKAKRIYIKSSIDWRKRDFINLKSYQYYKC